MDADYGSAAAILLLVFDPVGNIPPLTARCRPPTARLLNRP